MIGILKFANLPGIDFITNYRASGSMLFKNDTLKKIKKGEITVAFRKWKRPTVKEGGTLITPVGQLQIDEIKKVESTEDLIQKDILLAGYSSQQELTKELNKRESGELFIVKFHLAGPDPRLELRAREDISKEEFEALRKKLLRMDQLAKAGPWTSKVMKLIKENPGRRAQDLADELAVEKDWLKPNIRKLKNLGLTISLEVGYRLSQRGEAVLRYLSSRGIPRHRDDAVIG